MPLLVCTPPLSAVPILYNMLLESDRGRVEREGEREGREEQGGKEGEERGGGRDDRER